MDPTNSSYYKDAENFENDLWKLPGMQRQQFLAAAYYMSVVQQQQRTSTRAITLPGYDVSNTSSSEVTDNFLDLLALLFARYKKNTKTPGNVTAAALIKETTRWNIWIAKNAGPSSPAGVESDTDFLQKLQKWMNESHEATEAAYQSHGKNRAIEIGSNSSTALEPTDKFWSEMLEFWDERISTYVKSVQRGPNLVPFGQEQMKSAQALHSTRPAGENDRKLRSITSTDVRNAWNEIVARHQQADTSRTSPGVKGEIDELAFKDDWNLVAKMSRCLESPLVTGPTDDREQDNSADDRTVVGSWLQQAPDSRKGKGRNKTQNTSSKLRYTAFEECYVFRNRKWRQDYPPGNKREYPNEEDYEHFRKKVYHLEMLGTLVTMWRVFKQFRSRTRSKGIVLSIKFVATCPAFPMDRDDTAQIIKGWSGLDEKSSYRERVLEGLKPESAPFKRYFHCELQLLHLLHLKESEGEDTHSYIGVSKLSCDFCWQIILNAKQHHKKYRTKDGHHQISANCAFPFDITQDYGYIPEALLQRQSEMLKRILQEAVRIKNKYTVYTGMEQTQLGSIRGSYASQPFQIKEPQFVPGGLIAVTAAKIAVDSTTPSLEKVTLFDLDTMQPLSAESHFPRRVIPECLVIGDGKYVWPMFELRCAVGHAPLKFILSYRSLVSHQPNAWAERTLLERHGFRGDIWIFSLDSTNNIFRNIDIVDYDDIAYYDYEIPEWNQLRNEVDVHQFTWSRRWDRLWPEIIRHQKWRENLELVEQREQAQRFKARRDMDAEFIGVSTTRRERT